MQAEKQTVRGYELTEVLGEGGFGTVYRAFQPLVKREVAIKVILAEYANRPEFVRRFETEAQVIAQLEHLHIIPLYDFWRDPSGAYLVMRLLRGGNLEQWLKKNGSMPVPQALHMLDQVASALSLAHQTGVVHGDIKPANILLDNSNNAYLSDFGIATNIKQQGGDMDTIITGTPAYMTPEQIQKGELTPATDIYSLALLMFELLTGKTAYQANSFSSFVLQHLTAQIPDITSVLPSLPKKLNVVLHTATAKIPEQRFKNVTAFAQAFQDAFQEKEPEAIVVDSAMDDLISIPSDLGGFILTEETLDLEVAPAEIANPYKGLRAFQQGDSKDFFGREALTEQLVKRMAEEGNKARFLAVVGPSGSGKSSVVKAGLIPALRKGALPGSDRYFMVEMVPSTDALRELEGALLSVAIHPPENLHERLRGSPAGLHDILLEILPADGSEFLLLIDQFEEIYTQTNDNSVRAHFMDSLMHAINAPDSRLRAVITIRADFYDKPLLYPEFGALIRERTEIVLPLNREELRSAIVSPAERAGVRVEPELVEVIVQEVRDEPGALPLLQYALTENFERRTGTLMTVASYRESGGVLGSLARRAEELYSQMTPAQQEAIRQLFLRLVTLGEGTEDTRRRILWSELTFTETEDDPLQYVLDTYGKYRLLTFDKDPQTREPTVEVAHEALIRQWQRLRQWLLNSREDLRTQRRLVTALQEWRNSGKEDSFLATGVRLQQLEALAANVDITLTKEERQYIEVSVVRREKERLEEEARLARELQLERRSKRIFRVLVAVFAVSTVLGLLLAANAFIQQQNAVRKADEALSLNLAQQSRLNPRTNKNAASDGLSFSLESVRIENPPPFAQITLSNELWTPGLVRHYKGHNGVIFKVAFTPDGKQMLTGDFAGALILWDVASGKEIRRFGDDGKGHADQVYNLAISPDGKTAISTARTKQFMLWDMATGKLIRAFNADLAESKGSIWNVVYTPDSKYAIVGAGDLDANINLLMWDLETAKVVRRFKGHTNSVYALTISGDGTRLVSGDGAGQVIIWDTATGEPVQKINETTKRIFGVILSPDKKRLLIGGDDPYILVWDVVAGKTAQKVGDFTGTIIRNMAWSPTGDTFAVSILRNGTASVYDANTYARIASFTGHLPNVWGISYSPDGKYVFSSDDDDVIRWDIFGRGAESRRMALGAPGEALALHPNGGSALVILNGKLTLWDIDNAAQVKIFDATDVNAAAFSADGTRIASAQQDNSVTIWDAATGKSLQTLKGLNAPARAVAFSPDGKSVAAAGGNVQVDGIRLADNDIHIWDAASSTQQFQLKGHTAVVRALVFSPDGATLISGSDDGTVRLWTTKTGTAGAILGPDNNATSALEGHANGVLAVAINKDGRKIISGGRDKRVILWDIATSQSTVLGTHQSSIRSVNFSPDGKWAFSASGDLTPNSTSDNTLTLWDIASGQPLRIYRGHTQPVHTVQFSPTGNRALSIASDGLMIEWRVESLNEMLDWAYQNYQIYCITNPDNNFNSRVGTNTRCEPPNVVKSVIVKPAIPTQSAMTAAPTVQPTIAPTLPPATPVAANVTPVAPLNTRIDTPHCAVPTTAEFALPSASVDTAAFKKTGQVTIGYSDANTADLYNAYVLAWARYEASKSSQIRQIMAIDAKGSPTQQLADIRGMIAQKVDLIIVNPIEQANTSELDKAVDEALKANIPVIFVFHRTTGDKYTAFVGPDEFKIGCLMTQELITALDGEGVVLQLFGVESSYSDNVRRKGADAIFDMYTSVTRQAQRRTMLTESETRVSVGLSAGARIDGMWATNGFVARIAEDELAKRNMGPVPSTGTNDAGLSKLNLQRGYTVGQVRIPATMGAQAIQTALAILNGQSVSKSTEIPVQVIPFRSLNTFNLNVPDGMPLGDDEGLPDSFRPTT